jgi:CRISPR-associated protein Cmr4
MTIWQDVELTGIYTVTPTHCGTGQAAGAIDLPIAREAGTGFPVLPATSLKGVARDYAMRDSLSPEEGRLSEQEIDRLFGPALDPEAEGNLAAGALAFTEGRLVALPIRSLNRPFLHVSCPLGMERLARDLRALGVEDFLPDGWREAGSEPGGAQVADAALGGHTLVLEDLVYAEAEVVHRPGLSRLGQRLAELLPAEEKETRARLAGGLVVIPDQDFSDLMQRAVPVRARTKLTGGKTTDKWTDPESGKEESGNLWYEEFLPSDCLFVAFIGQRRQRNPRPDSGSGPPVSSESPLQRLRDRAGALEVVQIGGNETVGNGLCLWTFWSRAARQGVPP